MTIGIVTQLFKKNGIKGSSLSKVSGYCLLCVPFVSKDTQGWYYSLESIAPRYWVAARDKNSHAGENVTFGWTPGLVV